MAQYSHADVILLVNLALGVVLPQLTAVVTHRFSGSGLKSICLLVLSLIGGFLTQFLAQDNDFHWEPALISFGLTFIFSVGAHYGLLKGVGVTGTNGVIQVKLPAGVGSAVTVPGSEPVAPNSGSDSPS